MSKVEDPSQCPHKIATKRKILENFNMSLYSTESTLAAFVFCRFKSIDDLTRAVVKLNVTDEYARIIVFGRECTAANVNSLGTVNIKEALISTHVEYLSLIHRHYLIIGSGVGLTLLVLLLVLIMVMIKKIRQTSKPTKSVKNYNHIILNKGKDLKRRIYFVAESIKKIEEDFEKVEEETKVSRKTSIIAKLDKNDEHNRSDVGNMFIKLQIFIFLYTYCKLRLQSLLDSFP